MEIRPIEEILEPEGMGVPTLNALSPNVDNYKTLLMQPQGDIRADATGVCNFDHDLARAQFTGVLSDAVETQADLVVTPEYSVPWNVLLSAIKEGVKPTTGKLWILGCESIKYGELEAAKAEISSCATAIFEPLDSDEGRFLSPLAYVFLAPSLDPAEDERLVVLCQFKTSPMGDADHFEVNGLQCGKSVYRFGGTAGQDIKLVSLICSDAFMFLDSEAAENYDRTLVVHIQLNPKPRHEQFRLYRDRLMRFHGDATEILCLNWAQNVCQRSGDDEKFWKNIAASAWYLKPDKFDCCDSTLGKNHKRGLYYTWFNTFRVHALFFNYEAGTYLLDATKVAHVGVPAPMSRRRGPQLRRTCAWNAVAKSWEELNEAHDGFPQLAEEVGGAKDNILEIYNRNPFAAERVLALCAGKVNARGDWYSVRALDSCRIDSAEVIYRLTYCQDGAQEASSFRIARLKRCSRLWTILQDPSLLPPALEDMADGFKLEWHGDYAHQNAISNKGNRATVVYMGEEANIQQVEAVKKTLGEHLHRMFDHQDQSMEARQRLAVWYRNDDSETVLHDPHAYAQIDKTGDRSEHDIGRAE